MTLTWSKGTVKIALSQGDGLTVDADIISGLAVSKAVDAELLDGTPCFTVTHIATGRRATHHFRFDSMADARACAEALAHLPVDWEEANSPTFKKQWLVEAVTAISALCGGFLVESPMDGPVGGHA
ncbi:hypothetical protein [Mesorhizobium sp. B2-8-5]|uniref:hypothetical protein n=1 Tax=Mesorhizobium sp. B2-8-5 TaxID=2589903 RepID=UPI00112904D8|nr:hypothetical protein [Mesorhizobium sp. B2-8-5]UCI23706.1 hypothetical protein FJ430_19005 [Mesorhizobium sp. B2-8-5]